MKKRHIVLISLLSVFAIIIVACTQSDMFGEQNTRALKIFKEKKREFYEIIELFNDISVRSVAKIQYYNDNCIEVDKYYVSFEDGGEPEKNHDPILQQIIGFMKENKIQRIFNDSEEGFVYFTFAGWTHSVTLIYAPDNPDIDEIRQRNYCNAYYIDELWILRDPYDKNY